MAWTAPVGSPADIVLAAFTTLDVGGTGTLTKAAFVEAWTASTVLTEAWEDGTWADLIGTEDDSAPIADAVASAAPKLGAGAKQFTEGLLVSWTAPEAKHAAAAPPAPPVSSGAVSISAAFDGGNIERVGTASTPVQLKIRPDPYTPKENKTHMQWFSFRATAGPRTGVVKYQIVNAGKCSFPSAFHEAAEVCVSTNRRTWSRVKSTSYDKSTGLLAWEWNHSGAPSSSARRAHPQCCLRCRRHCVRVWLSSVCSPPALVLR